MSETLTASDQNTSFETGRITPDSTPEEHGGRLRDRLRQAGRETYNYLDTAAAIAVASSDIAYAREQMDVLDPDGLIGRESNAEISRVLTQDILLDFRAATQRLGYRTDEELVAMPTELRQAAAEAAAYGHIAEIIIKLQIANPDLKPEELAAAARQRAADIATLLAMSEAEQDEYEQTQLQYQELEASIAVIEAEREGLRAQRKDQAALMGRVILQTFVIFAGTLRNLPTNAAAGATTAVMGVGEWYQSKEKKGKKIIMISAVGVAAAGLASYIAMRLAGGTGAPPMKPAADYSQYTSDQFGGGASPDQSFGGGVAPDQAFGGGAKTVDMPQFGGGQTPDQSFGGGANSPQSFGGGLTPDQSFGGNATPDQLPTPTGIDVSGMHTTEQLFASHEAVATWPDTITVSHWNHTNHDGSLWGISELMLHRSGVAHPDTDQIREVADALRPQAQLPNGGLLAGQTLHLQPALNVLANTK